MTLLLFRCAIIGMTMPATAQHRYLDRISRARSLAQKELEEYQSRILSCTPYVIYAMTNVTFFSP